MLQVLLLWAGLVGPVWAGLSCQRCVSVFLCYLENGKGVGGTSCWSVSVLFSCAVFQLSVLEVVWEFCMRDILVRSGGLFQNVRRSPGMLGIQSF